MAFVVRDRVLETSTTTGTGTFDLDGAEPGYRSFYDAIGETNSTYYAIVNGNEWEVGFGTILNSAPVNLYRTTVYASSNSGNRVNFSAGTKQVFCTYAATRAVIRDNSGRVGIGVAEPTGTLDVAGTDPSIITRTYTSPPGVPQSAVQIGLGGTAAGAIGTGPSFLFFTNNSASAKTFLGRLTAIIEDTTAGSEKGGIAFSVRQNGADTTANTEVLRVTADSKVGIGTTVPSEKLDVIGNVKASNAIIKGSTSGTITLAAPSTAGTNTATFPAESGGVVLDSATQTLTNKTLTNPTINGFTGNTSVINVGSGQLYKDTSGFVGIGTTSPADFGRFVVQGGQAGAANANIVARTPGSAQGERADYTFYSTFQGTADNASRRTADIIAGFNGGAWGNEYLSFNVGYGGSANDGKNVTIEQARLTGNGLFQFNSGYGSVATAYGCRAWVNFNGTGTVAIRASGNVTSITDNGVGDYTVNFTTAMPDANYSSIVTSNSGSPSAAGNYVFMPLGYVANTSSYRFNSGHTGAAYVDCASINVAIFR